MHVGDPHDEPRRRVPGQLQRITHRWPDCSIQQYIYVCVTTCIAHSSLCTVCPWLFCHQHIYPSFHYIPMFVWLYPIFNAFLCLYPVFNTSLLFASFVHYIHTTCILSSLYPYYLYSFFITSLIVLLSSLHPYCWYPFFTTLLIFVSFLHYILIICILSLLHPYYLYLSSLHLYCLYPIFTTTLLLVFLLH